MHADDTDHHDDKVQYVPCVSHVGILVHYKALGEDLDETLCDEDDREDKVNLDL